MTIERLGTSATASLILKLYIEAYLSRCIFTLVNCDVFIFTYVHMIIFVCIVSRHNKYNTVYFFKTIHLLSFFLFSPLSLAL